MGYWSIIRGGCLRLCQSASVRKHCNYGPVGERPVLGAAVAIPNSPRRKWRCPQHYKPNGQNLRDAESLSRRSERTEAEYRSACVVMSTHEATCVVSATEPLQVTNTVPDIGVLSNFLRLPSSS
jgi:hypothetical protein